MKKRILLIFAVLILLAAILTGALLWEEILLMVAPKAVLTSALPRLFVRLETRFQDHPLVVVASALSREGEYTATMALEAKNAYVGATKYDMTVQFNGTEHRVGAAGTIRSTMREADVALYLDGSFLAVSSQKLLQGDYYGITYDSFQEDVRRIPLSSLIISDTLLEQWDTALQGIRETITAEYPTIPEVSPRDVQTLLLTAVAMPCTVDRCAVPADGAALECTRLSYSMNGEGFVDAISKATGDTYPEDTELTVSFYLHRRDIAMIRLQCTAGRNAECYSIFFGENVDESPLRLEIVRNQAGQQNSSKFRVATTHLDSRYLESWTYETEQGQGSLLCDWNPETGVLVLNNGSSNVTMTLEPIESGFRITTKDFSQFLSLLLSREAGSMFAGAQCTMNVHAGSNIAKPVYKNIDQWSLADLTQMMKNAAELIGIPSFG